MKTRNLLICVLTLLCAWTALPTMADTQERMVIDTDFTDWSTVGSSGGTLDIATNFSNENITFTLVGTSCKPSGQNTGKFGDLTGFLMAEKNAGGTVTTSAFANVTKIRYFHGATGSKRGWGLQKKGANDADWVTLSDKVADPATGMWVECDVNEENVQFRWWNLADAQNAYMFELEVYAQVEITAEQATLGTAVAPAPEAGSIKVDPVSESYDVGSEVSLVAIDNFGYNFACWTNAAGEVVGTESALRYTIVANEVLTANFVKVDTYELVLTTEGGANDYMVAPTPAATLIDGRQMYEAGTQVTLAAASNPILTFTHWDTGNTSPTLSVTMDEDQAYTAYYSSIDYIVGWDFVRSGANGRPADFASNIDNETTTLYLTNAAGQTQGWLDKSAEYAGGYESLAGAAVNWKAFGEYYFETRINATEFKNIRVQARMLYNYKAHRTQRIEYSLDGKQWTVAGEVTMTAAKTPYDIKGTLGEEANNQPTVYIRFIPDYTSEVDGTDQDNKDGTTIADIYILGDKELVNDGMAPRLLSTIPTDGATEASATGKVVLQFDEKVKLINPKATIGNREVTGTVTGSTVTYAYLGLDYATPYTFKVEPGSIADLTDNALAEAISISFTTLAPPTVNPGMYDAVVSTADELLAALKRADGKQRFRIFLHDGLYDLGSACLTPVPAAVSLIGESMEGTVIRNLAPQEGIGVSATLLLKGDNIYMQDLTIKNAYDYKGSTGRAVAIQDKGNKNVFKNVRQLSHQDTYYTNNNSARTYYEGGEVHGTVDFICGGGDVFFQGTTLYLEERGGNCITAPATATQWGYVFNECIIDGHPITDGDYSLGRPWQGTPRCVWINTTMKVIPSAGGWTEMSVVPALFAEYNSRTENGTPIDCSKRRTTFESTEVTYNPVLTAEEAAAYTIANVLAGDDSWQPQLLTEQAAAPAIGVADGIISWAASDYVLCYAICKNGKVVAFTNDNSYTIPADATDSDRYSIRAANEMGGLGMPSAEVTRTSVTTPENHGQLASTVVYNAAGVAVDALQSGLNIVRSTYSDGTTRVKKVVKR